MAILIPYDENHGGYKDGGHALGVVFVLVFTVMLDAHPTLAPGGSCSAVFRSFKPTVAPVWQP